MPLQINSFPHLRSKITTAYIMRHVIYALIPTSVAAIYFFRYNAVLLITNCVITSLITEWIILKILKKTPEINNFSAALTGLLFALILPPDIKWYAATLGSIFAIFVVKHLFGGLGKNIFNPALMSRAFLMAAYPKMLTHFIPPCSVDTITTATPLAIWKFNHQFTQLTHLFWGNTAGSLGETSGFCILLGGIYIFLRKLADWRIPLSALITIVIISSIGYLINPINGSITFHLLSGGLLLGLFFMATDPVTTPTTKKGRYIFGIGIAIQIMIIRYFSGLPEGVMYAILFFNALTPLINRYTKPKRFI